MGRWNPGAAMTAALMVVMLQTSAATAATAELPDGRSYEVATPGAEKGGGEVYPGFAQIGADGESVAYSVNNVFGDASNGLGALGTSLAYGAERGPDGWSSSFRADFPTPTPTTLQSNFGPLFYGASADLSHFFYTIDYGADTGFSSGAWEDSDDGALLLAGRDPNVVTNPRVQASSADGEHRLIWGDQVPLAPVPGGVTPTGSLLYDYHDGALRHVGLDNAGNLIHETGSLLASINGAESPGSAGQVTSLRNAVSDDGSRIFFVSREAGAAAGDPLQLWVRIDGTRTIEVSASAHSLPQPALELVQFAGASSDGTRAYFVTTGSLTDDATGSGPFLYRFDLPRGATSGALSLVAGVEHPIDDEYLTSGNFPAVLAQTIVSDDGSRVYYRSEDDGGSLYVYDAEAGTTELVADDTGELLVASVPDLANANTPDITPDGRHLAFQAAAALTASDVNPGLDIYLYDADAGALTLVSAAAADAPAPATPYNAEFLDDTGTPGTYSQKVQSDANYVSDDGSYVFFETRAGLVGHDANGTLDVYRWRRGDGVAAVSDVTGANPSTLNGASPDGRDVFFGTFNDLILNDGDDAFDIYDARIGGGFPVPKVPTPACDGDACQGSYAAAPFVPVPGSDAVSGPGNVEPGTPRPVLRVTKVSAAAKRKLAREGKVTVVLRTNAAGRVSAQLAARLGKSWVTVDRAAKSPSAGGTTKLTLALSKRARRYLATHKSGMRVRIQVTYAQDPRAYQSTFVIRNAKKGTR